jgi:hypothetical protein
LKVWGFDKTFVFSQGGHVAGRAGAGEGGRKQSLVLFSADISRLLSPFYLLKKQKWQQEPPFINRNIEFKEKNTHFILKV